MQSLEITALDTLFFKDGKPFSMGEESWAKGIFPPYPSAIYGMLRSIWFAENMGHLVYANNAQSDPTLGLRITGYLPVLDGMAAFPIPADLYGADAKGKAQPLILEPHAAGFQSEYALSHVLRADVNEKYEELHGKAMLLQAAFAAYLQAWGDRYEYERMSDFTCEEPKVGIGKDRFTRTSADGQLYRLSMRRLSKKDSDGKVRVMSFLLGFDGVELPQNGMTRIGAETKSAAYQQRDFPMIDRQFALDHGQFKIYLATPAVFEEGSYPKTWFAHHGIKLIAAAMGKADYIGGFDIQAGMPKPMYKAVPAGTVYYVEVADRSRAEELCAQLHQGSIYDLAPQDDAFAQGYRNQGFGLSFIGNIHAQKTQ